MSLLRQLLRRGPTQAEPRARLLPASDIVDRYRRDGGDAPAAVANTLAQLAGLRREVEDEASWTRLCGIVRRARDPWNADDWPLGFDALLCCVPLCTDVDYECARCPVGRTQDGMSCAHPESAFGAIWGLVERGDRDGLRERIERLERLLG